MPLAWVLLAFARLAGADLDDAVLAERIRDGDREAFRTFFERYQGTLLRYLQRRGLPEADAEDVLQQAFVALWEQRARLEPGQSVRGLLFTIGYRRALNVRRKAARLAADAEPEGAADAPAPDADVRHAQVQAELHRAIQALPERRRAVFELCFLEELTYREAAAVLDISVKTVENQMGHALKALRAALAPFR